MTSQDWKEVEKSLKSFYSSVKLRCDGYEVTLLLRQISQFKNAILVYVNGVIKGEWLCKDCEERRRFLRPVKSSLYSQKQKAALKKISKSLRKKTGLLDPEASYTSYRYDWTSFKALKSHLSKHNSNIELVREQSVTADDKN